ncbi:hypothetical protein D3C80_868900 [compost metagenome]
MGQINNAGIKFTELNVVILPVSVFGEIPAFRGLFAQVTVAGDVRIDIRKVLHPFALPLRNTLIQLRIKLTVPLPVPHHALAERGHADAGPVLRPNPIYLHAAVAQGVQLLLANVGPALNPQRHAIVNPVWQFRLTAQQPR